MNSKEEKSIIKVAWQMWRLSKFHQYCSQEMDSSTMRKHHKEQTELYYTAFQVLFERMSSSAEEQLLKKLHSDT